MKNLKEIIAFIRGLDERIRGLDGRVRTLEMKSDPQGMIQEQSVSMINGPKVFMYINPRSFGG